MAIDLAVMKQPAGPLSYTSEDAAVGYAVLRFTMGIDLFVHGAWRLPHLARFVSATAAGFAGSGLPQPLTVGFLWAIPFIEVVLGALMAAGLGLRIVLPLSGLYIAALVFGSTARGEYTAVAEQLAYALIIGLLTVFRTIDNRWSLDAARSRPRH